ncbi:transglutaminase-like cysteine peptidase [Aurantimonas sp. C2-5-R2]|uniref:transglutaminase-like cysteine peptidase n=1 Tax=unclassified Aurantimonas TaxID=2638230 RepID=UPI002E193FF7|nr:MULTISPECIES: transglutaminase-like cysteine peptidase [unclassified Aurantimonas]MEC5410714.1 transglutaminase-like cysteine peptidase [Aurantimonas sp. C2-4-R8]
MKLLQPSECVDSFHDCFNHEPSTHFSYKGEYEMGAFRAFGATVLLCLSVTATSARSEPRGAFMGLGNPTTQPIGHLLFCQEYSRECEPPAAGITAAPLKLSRPLILSVAAVNTTINARIKARSDLDIYGVEERWAYPAVEGDCEDFVLLKRRVLSQKGIDLANLLITVVLRPDGEGHAVLTLRTTQGDFILDNLEWRILAWADTPYKYLKRQSSADPGRWIDIGHGGDVIVSAVEK